MRSQTPLSQPVLATILLLIGLLWANEMEAEGIRGAANGSAGRGKGRAPSAEIILAQATTPQEQDPAGDESWARRRMERRIKRESLKAGLAKMQADAEQIRTLADALQKDLENSSVHVLSLDVIKKAEQIEKLAKQIKTTAKTW